MAKKHGDVARTVLKYEGRFNFKDLYEFFFDVVAANGYVVTDEAFAQKEKDVGDEVEIEWEFSREVDDYTKFEIWVGFYVSELTEVIVKKDGAEVKTNEGSIKIVVKGQVITDWQGLWESNKFLLKLRDFYERYFFKGTLDDYEVDVYNDIFLFENEVKSFLHQPRF